MTELRPFSPKDREALWDLLWENSISGLAIINEDNKFLRANPEFCKIVEYTEKELQKLSFSDITLPSDNQIDVDLAKEVQAGRRGYYDMVKRYISKTGRVVSVHLRVLPFKIGGEFVYFLSQVSEIKEVRTQPEYNQPQIKYPRQRSKLFDWVPIGAGILFGILVLVGVTVLAHQLGNL